MNTKEIALDNLWKEDALLLLSKLSESDPFTSTLVLACSDSSFEEVMEQMNREGIITNETMKKISVRLEAY